MTLYKSVGRISETGQLQIPARILWLVGGKPGELVELIVGSRNTIHVVRKNEKEPWHPKPKTIQDVSKKRILDQRTKRR